MNADLMKFNVLLFALLINSNATADTYETFDVDWSGGPWGSPAASAQAVMTIDTTTFDLSNLGVWSGDLTPYLTKFDLTVSGASTGSADGVWHLSDFPGIFMNTNSNTLPFNPNINWIGQPLSDGYSYGCPGGCSSTGENGDFGMAAGFGAPFNDTFFRIELSDNQRLQLTSITPVHEPTASAPEPATTVLIGIGIAGLGFVYRRHS